jgi:hypothetical protein
MHLSQPELVVRVSADQPSEVEQSATAASTHRTQSRYLRSAVAVIVVLVGWAWFDSWNGAWVNGYRSGRCEAKCGFEADAIDFVPATQQIVCTCRDGKIWRLSQ